METVKEKYLITGVRQTERSGNLVHPIRQSDSSSLIYKNMSFELRTSEIQHENMISVIFSSSVRYPGVFGLECFQTYRSPEIFTVNPL